MSEKSLKQKMIEELEIREEQFSSHCSDLYILPDSTEQCIQIKEFAKSDGWSAIQMYCSNVKGNPWYGKYFVEIAFAYSEYFKRFESR